MLREGDGSYVTARRIVSAGGGIHEFPTELPGTSAILSEYSVGMGIDSNG